MQDFEQACGPLLRLRRLLAEARACSRSRQCARGRCPPPPDTHPPTQSVDIAALHSVPWRRRRSCWSAPTIRSPCRAIINSPPPHHPNLSL